jgi:Zn-dependent peptidase ImmA (M78 family)/DNA-binding XRE family transcriptional regulator
MKNKTNPQMITLARESRGITQKELSDKLKVTQGLVSKIEQGLISVNTELLVKISKILNYPITFYSEDFSIYSCFNYHRKRMSLNTKTLNKIDALINIRKIHIQKLFKSVELVNSDIPTFYIDDNNSPKDIANKLRHYWKVSKGPINNLVQLIEQYGGIVIVFDFETEKIDGLSLQLNTIPPLFFINKNISGDRLRFTLAHELGHMVMHRYPTDIMEQEADLFASEFLMPSHEIIQQLEYLSLSKLGDLKRYWKVSMAAIIKKASYLKLLLPSREKSLWIQLSKAGYRKKEPIDIPIEIPNVLKEIINAHRNTLGYSVEEMSKILLLETSEYSELYQPNEKILRIINNIGN